MTSSPVGADFITCHPRSNNHMLIAHQMSRPATPLLAESDINGQPLQDLAPSAQQETVTGLVTLEDVLEELLQVGTGCTCGAVH